MFLQGTRRGSHELKAMTVLFNAFGLSLTKRWKTSGFFGIPPPPNHPRSRVYSSEDWTRRVLGEWEAQL